MTTPNVYRALIIDDERLARQDLATLLAQHSDIDVVAEVASLAEAIPHIQAGIPDVIFLDIQLRGESGFELFKKTAITCPVVFVTAFDQYAMRAFEVNSLDYLLKPIQAPRLAESLRRLRQHRASAPEANPAALSLGDLFFYEINRQAQFFRIGGIVYIEALGGYCHVMTEHEAAPLLVARGIGEWERLLPAEHFVRIHRSYIVHVAFVERLERLPAYTYAAHLKTQEEPIPVSRRRGVALRRLLKV